MYFLFKICALLLVFPCLKSHAQPHELMTHYEVFGEGKPILILNGGPGMNSNGFVDMAQQLAKKGYKTIIYDQRGTGKSKIDHINAQTINMDLMVKDIEQLRKKLKIKKWVILGHSFGGLLATHYYQKHHKVVEKMIFSSSGGVNLKFMGYVGKRITNNLTALQNDSLIYFQEKLTKGDTTLHTRQKRVEFLANAYVYDKQHAKKIALRLVEANFMVNGLVMEDLQKIKYDYTHKFLNKKTPVLVIQGINDIISIETAQEIKDSFGNAEIKFLKNCAHYGWLDAHSEYFDTIDFFLKKNKK